MNSITGKGNPEQCEETVKTNGAEVTPGQRGVIEYTAAADERWFVHHHREFYRVRRLFPDEIAPYEADTRFVLVVRIAGVGLLRFPLTNAQAQAAAEASDTINAAALAVVKAARSRKAVG